MWENELLPLERSDMEAVSSGKKQVWVEARRSRDYPGKGVRMLVALLTMEQEFQQAQWG